MSKKIISTDAAPAAIGPYSQAVCVGELLFASGQIPLDAATGQMVGSDITEQTTQAMKNVQGILASCGLTFDDVVKSTVFLADMGDFQAFNAKYEQYFPNSKPARSCVQVARLPKDALVEVEVIAALKK